jgi:hypothetical protein
VNLLNNEIGVDQAKALASILKEHPTLKSLCGNSGEETELDMSGKGMDAGDVIMLAAEIVDNGALSVLNLASNNLGKLVLPDGWSARYKGKSYQEYAHLDGSRQKDHPGRPDGIIAVANAIPDMGALTSLNLSSNNLKVEGAKIVAGAIKVDN